MALGMAQRAVASGARVFELLDRAPRLTAAPDAPPLPPGGGRVELRDVTFGYDGARAGAARHRPRRGGRPARSRSSGPTGSGKTTLVMLIPRLYDVDEGAVLVDGVDVRDVDPASLRREVAVVSDDAFLFSATLRREHRLRAARGERGRGRGAPPSAPGSASCSRSCPTGSTRSSASAG